MLLILLTGTALFSTQGQTKPSATKKPPTKGSAPATAKTATPAKTITTPSGLQYKDLVEGTGVTPKVGDVVVVHYTGRFTNGKVFDTSVGKRPFEFALGRSQVIKGWDEGVGSMKVGGKRKLIVPANLAYGSQGYPGVIPPNSTLVFMVQLLRIK